MAFSRDRVVHDLTNNTFRGFVEENSMVLVAFVLPFLPVSQRFSREYEEAAQLTHSSEVQFAKVDCQKETEVYEQFEFGRWPTVKLFRGFDSIKQYEGAWKSSDIISYVTRQSLPTISIITADSLREFKSTGNNVVVGYFMSDDKDSQKAFTSVAEAMHEDYVFGVTNDAILAEIEQTNIPGITIYKNFDRGKINSQLTHDSQAIYDFVKATCTPSVIEFQPELHSSYVDTGLPLGYILAETVEELAQLSKPLETLAEKYKDNILFCTVNIENFDSLADILHLELDELPAFAIKEPIRGHQFLIKQRQQLSEEVLSIFVKDFIEGKLKPTVKSEPVPETLQGPVIVVVGHTFDDIVINNEKDVLLDYYTQWCGPCKAMAPIYEKLATLYASNSTDRELVTIAKIDAEANDVPGDIRGFPTFKLFPADSKESPVVYDGPWTIRGFANFVRDNGKYKVDVLLEEEINDSKMFDTVQQDTVQDTATKEADTPLITPNEILGGAPQNHDEL